jgi:signal peptidase I
MKTYSLRKSRSILTWNANRFKKKQKSLSTNQREGLSKLLEKLDQAVLQGHRQEASDLAHEVEEIGQEPLKKSFFEHLIELAIVIVVAVFIATLVRQVVFEPYEIPTGSMRPTFREHDNVIVSKTSFGINAPFTTGHLYFDPSLVQRTSIVIFSGDQIDLQDTDSKYLWIFPYKKRYIKRCMAKPGDTVYFYGGRIYGMDKEGHDIPELLNSPWIENISYVPFYYMEGVVSRPKKNEFVFSQMHEAIGRMILLPTNQMLGEVFNGKEWVKDDPQALLTQHDSIKTYSDFWGFRNFALARLLTKEQLADQQDLNKNSSGDGLLYLEICHTPYLNYSGTLFQQSSLGIKPLIGSFTTTIPLNKQHINTLMDHMYTARFVVKDGRVARYNFETSRFGPENPSMPGVPDGTYEFYNGVAYQIGFTSIPWKLGQDHPLYNHDPSFVQLLFNLGIDFNTALEPTANNQTFYPRRYAFFRDKALYLLGASIFAKEDPLLVQFNKQELDRQEQAAKNKPYIAFKDYGAPLKSDGSLDKEFLKIFGLKIPEGHYLTLGDNHAMSADSRFFGFVPEANLQGAPDLIVWPPGERWGCPPQKPYPWFNIPRTIVWGILGLIGLIYYIVHHRRLRRSAF